MDTACEDEEVMGSVEDELGSVDKSLSEDLELW